MEFSNRISPCFDCEQPRNRVCGDEDVLSAGTEIPDPSPCGVVVLKEATGMGPTLGVGGGRRIPALVKCIEFLSVKKSISPYETSSYHFEHVCCRRIDPGSEVVVNVDNQFPDVWIPSGIEPLQTDLLVGYHRF